MFGEQNAEYLTKQNHIFYYYRRVPSELAHLDSRNCIKLTLRTDSYREAKQRSMALNKEVEAYWKNLIQENSEHDSNKFKRVTDLARTLGLNYTVTQVLAKVDLIELITRIKPIKEIEQVPNGVQAALGGEDEPVIKLRKALKQYWSLTKHRLLNKSDNQARKWQHPRQRAVDNFVNVCGNKSINKIVRNDLINLRDWWLERIEEEDLKPATANKDFMHLKDIIETVSDHNRMKVDMEWLFKRVRLNASHDGTRLPFKPEFIQNQLLNFNSLSGLHEEAQHILFVLADTGARPSEIVGLRPEDIKLEAEIPHIHIQSYKNRELKTRHSDRKIPLVGAALFAFQRYPNGFTHYRQKPDTLSANLNKFLRNHNLLPTDKHSLYSLRHSFQDRLTKLNMPDRISTDLMGHAFKRPKYGLGSSLEQKREWLEKMKFKPPSSAH